MVDILIEGHNNFISLRDATFEKFGEGDQDNPYIEDYLWMGKVTYMDLEYKDILNIGLLNMTSKELYKQMQEYDKQKAKEGAEKGF